MAPQPLTQPAHGRDPDQAADHAVDAAQEGGLPLLGEPGVHGHPDDHAGGRGEVGVDDGGGGAGPGVVRVTTVEAVPAQPQDAGADRRHDQVVGQGMLSISQEPGSEDPGRHEPGHAGRHVDDVATGEVERSLLGEVAAAPEHEGVDAVDEGRPQRDQQAPGAELDPAQHAPEEQQRGDGGEDELEVGQRRRREVEGDDGVGRRHGLALFTGRVGDAARFADEVLEEVLPPPHTGELGLYPVRDTPPRASCRRSPSCRTRAPRR